jgi:hypothetical protein
MSPDDICENFGETHCKNLKMFSDFQLVFGYLWEVWFHSSIELTYTILKLLLKPIKGEGDMGGRV